MNTQAQTNSTNVNPTTIAAGLAQSDAVPEANPPATVAESVSSQAVENDYHGVRLDELIDLVAEVRNAPTLLEKIGLMKRVKDCLAESQNEVSVKLNNLDDENRNEIKRQCEEIAKQGGYSLAELVNEPGTKEGEQSETPEAANADDKSGKQQTVKAARKPVKRGPDYVYRYILAQGVTRQPGDKPGRDRLTGAEKAEGKYVENPVWVKPERKAKATTSAADKKGADDPATSKPADDGEGSGAKKP